MSPKRASDSQRAIRYPNPIEFGKYNIADNLQEQISGLSAKVTALTMLVEVLYSNRSGLGVDDDARTDLALKGQPASA